MRRIFTLLTSLLLTACGSTGPQTNTASPEAVRAFYVGLAALQVGDDPRAKIELTKATELAPNEPAAWANLGILQIRQKDFEAAAQSLEKARGLADKNPKIYETIALLEKQRGNFDASQANLQKAIDLDPTNVKAMYALAKEKERQANDAEARKLYGQILTVKADNLEVKLEAMRLAAKQNDFDALRQLFADVKPSPDWEAEVKTQYEALNSAIASADSRAVLPETSFFRNTLLRNAAFRKAVDEVKFSDTTIGEPMTKPVVLQVPGSSPAPADMAITFRPQTPTGAYARWSKFVYLNGEDAPVVATATENGIRIASHTVPFTTESPDGLLSFDFDYDFKNDIAVASTQGFRLYRQTDSGFAEVTSETKLSTEVINGFYVGAWAFDAESDGDLDLVLGGTASPSVLQNNSDNTFTRLNTFGTGNGLLEFASGDLDEDGDVDAALVDGQHNLRIFINERLGIFRPLDISVASVRRLAVGDVDTDGSLELIMLTADGSVKRFSEAERKVTDLFRTVPTQGSDAIHLADVDNNGAADIIITDPAGTRMWVRNGEQYSEAAPVPCRRCTIADSNGDGRLDLAGMSETGATIFLGSGNKNYNWQTVRPRASKTTGDQRVNSFGIGGELELRAGLNVQKRLITEPVVHFGLGEQPAADVLRVVWQNGFVQAEFDLKPNETIAAEQRLKGSCPHLFAFNGEKFKLVKDAPPWSPALGLKINAQDTFGIIETEEWFKIPGDALKPTKENFYELRITGEYWESFYLDQYSLLVVDHPEDTEVFTDERFSVPPPELKVFTTSATREFGSARNDGGDDVTSLVRHLDEKYLDGFERGTFQGVAKDHYVEIELPTDAPADKRLAIIADGWVHPTDASINVQLGQSSKEKPRSLSLEVRDATGEWRIAKENLGFPAGKMKTMIVELPAGVRAARLRTNMEIFWDKLAWAFYEDDAQNRTTRLDPAASDLRYRGFSVIEKADDSSPEKPVYDRLLTTTQRWRDMEGYFTRYGDVRELLLAADDRYVLANAGDELVLKFAALPPPPAGYKRDFVLIGNGWIKDGDLNSVFSKTLLPLPTHASNDYSRAPTTLENDPVYQKNKTDWLNFHTRYVAPDAFQNALRTK